MKVRRSDQRKLGVLLLILQAVFLVIYWFLAEYSIERDAKEHSDNDFNSRFVYFIGTHMMIFIGFGYLMAFLQKYGFGAVGFSFLLAAVAIQWAIILQGLMSDKEGYRFGMDLAALIKGDYAAAAVLITFGVLIGKTSPLQLLVVLLIEVLLYMVNLYVVEVVLGASDAGGSLVIHAFGAYFGLSCSAVMQRVWHMEHPNEGSTYTSDLFSLIGTTVLWIFWPTFNGALLRGTEVEVAVVNTYCSLAASVLSAFAFSAFLSTRHKLTVAHIQNSTLAGGVAIGAVANFQIGPFGAGLVGVIAGAVSVMGFAGLQPCLARKLGIHDTCGVHNLHGMPGILGGIASIVAALVASQDFKILPLRLDKNGPSEALGRSPSMQAFYQAWGLAATLGIALFGGILSGCILRFFPLLNPTPMGRGFHDQPYWNLPKDVCLEDAYEQLGSPKTSTVAPISHKPDETSPLTKYGTNDRTMS